MNRKLIVYIWLGGICILTSCTKSPHTCETCSTPSIVFTVKSDTTTISQFIATGNTGIDSGSVVTLAGTSSISGTITSITFGVSSLHSNDVRSIGFSGKTIPFINTTATATGLLIAVAQNVPTTLPSYFISYTGTNTGSVSGDTVSVVPISITINGYTVPVSTIAVPKQIVVNSKIDYLITRPSKRNIVSAGVMDVMNVEFHVNAANDIALNTLPLTLQPNANVSVNTSSNSIRIIDSASGSVIGTTSTAFEANGGDGSVTLLNGNNHFLKGTTHVLLLAVSIDHIGITGTNTVEASLSPTTSFAWTDIFGGASIPETGIDFMPTYTTNPITIQGRPSIQ